MDIPPVRPRLQPPRRGGGVFIALGVVLGAGLGMPFGEASLGLMLGLGTGIALAIGISVLDRR